jgi:hypothetical protein
MQIEHSFSLPKVAGSAHFKVQIKDPPLITSNSMCIEGALLCEWGQLKVVEMRVEVVE